jgi:hypothetical protein
VTVKLSHVLRRTVLILIDLKRASLTPQLRKNGISSAGHEILGRKQRTVRQAQDLSGNYAAGLYGLALLGLIATIVCALFLQSHAVGGGGNQCVKS